MRPSRPQSEVKISGRPRWFARCHTHFLSLAVCATLAACAGSPTYGPVPAGSYRVQSGDTLYGIARSNNASTADLVRWNGLTDPDKIEVGQVLRVVPPAGTSRAPAAAAASSGSASSGAARPRAQAKPAPKAAPAPAAPRTATNKIPMVWPADGPVLANFNGSSNKGVDIGGKAGDPVYAAAAGKVVYAGNGLRGYGNLVMVQHENGYLTAYAHNRAVLVKEGASVSKGQKIAEMGDTDSQGTVKLHFEVRQKGTPFNPRDFLPSR
ncbi:peptidoglycan DD-metalloendopeptidase family protein [Pandoraea apista]|uniref:peptidoglycan DD-metalloendopeptidase family protein n=1 Tax=Pandoraea apista TaxID=93218 RepID=UPI000659DA5B|nr:peptidoglycan DD-metalloendopeptidase family protein [Pandoraea apista]RRW97148.1 LysM peptidoglycan-binding domain-containing protein [Pandoraea apista]RRX03995.1 LysM peptidoglycan-binding domain-containing protein [Pandoraea apista]CFB60859.1 Murein hydrolase activator NlpD precursor [Pandoraea apista]